MLETDDQTVCTEPVIRGWRDRWPVAVAVTATLFVAACSDGGDPVNAAPSGSTTTAAASARDVMEVGSSNGFTDLPPGSYFIDPDGDGTTPLRVTYYVGAEGWSAWFGASKQEEPDRTMLTITTITNLIGEGCLDHTPLQPPVGPTVDDLATALSQLAPFDVTTPPTEVMLLGYEGKHLQLTVPEEGATACVDGELHSWISPLNDGGATSFSGYDGPGQTEDFWILDVEGTRLVLVKLESPDTSADALAERDAIFDSIRIEP